MKRLFFVFCLLPLITISQSTLQVSDSRQLYMEKVIQAPDFDKDKIYIICLDWVSNTFKSPDDVINFDNKELGKIKGTFVSDYPISLSNQTFSNTFEILIKDGRLKIKFFDIYNLNGHYTLEKYVLKKNNTFRPMYSSLTESVTEKLNMLILSLESTIKEYSEPDSDW